MCAVGLQKGENPQGTMNQGADSSHRPLMGKVLKIINELLSQAISSSFLSLLQRKAALLRSVRCG